MVETKPLYLRITDAQKAWLEYKAIEHKRSQNAEIQAVMQAAINADPLCVMVRQGQYPNNGATFFSVSIGDGRPFFETPDKASAIERAHEKAEEIGLGRDAIDFAEPSK